MFVKAAIQCNVLQNGVSLQVVLLCMSENDERCQKYHIMVLYVNNNISIGELGITIQGS